MTNLRKHVSLYGALLCGALLSSPVDAQVTRRVPEDIATIGGAISVSANNDIIDVAPGRYVGTINFHGKAVTVRSRGGAYATILDNVRMGSVVVFDQGEGPGSVLEGFTITGGSSYKGGGIYIENASPTIRACILNDNHGYEGGGIYAIDSSALIEGCFLFDNWAFQRNGVGGVGGAIYAEESALTINHLSVTHNSAAYVGDGLYSVGANGSPTVTNSVFHTGADIQWSLSASPVIEYCVLDGTRTSSTTNIWADPQFVDSGFWDPHHPDMHLTYNSPCIGAGTILPSPSDIDGESRDATPDIGADEFIESSHWYTGEAISGGMMRFNATGVPGDHVFWLIAGGLLPGGPVPTPFGDLYLDFTFLSFDMASANTRGLVQYDVPIPGVPQFVFYSQVLVGSNPFDFSLPRHVLAGG